MAPEHVGSPTDILEIPIPVKAYLGPITLEIPAKPAQVAIVVRMATQELIAAGIITKAPEFSGSGAGTGVGSGAAGKGTSSSSEKPAT